MVEMDVINTEQFGERRDDDDEEVLNRNTVVEPVVGAGSDEASTLETCTDYINEMKIRNAVSPDKTKHDRFSDDREKQRLKEMNERKYIKIRDDIRNYKLALSSELFKEKIKLYGLDLRSDPLANDCTSDDFQSTKVGGCRRRENSTCSTDSIDDLYNSFEDEEEYFNIESAAPDFISGTTCETEDYIGKANQELVVEFMHLEDEIEEKKSVLDHIKSNEEKIRIFREEIETLKKENELLRIANDDLVDRIRSYLQSKT
ncbi:hypothetical protein CDAR_164351 [Caerostris darwini]|uniref:Uncharacterized protein n=1 Tax=Caerostris darwini TaxID=1538125 RepID=A0AAV4VRC0_9ARAC|nr:hypothetical protein CDAR_164351 [Caerostris darwini]